MLKCGGVRGVKGKSSRIILVANKAPQLRARVRFAAVARAHDADFATTWWRCGRLESREKHVDGKISRAYCRDVSSVLACEIPALQAVTRSSCVVHPEL